MNSYLDSIIDIHDDRIDGCLDSFFYDGIIASAKHDGWEFQLFAVGDISIIIDEGNHYRNHQVDEAIREHELTDEKLRMLDENGEIEWRNNNWFEVLWKKPGDEDWNCSIGNVAHDYDSALQLLKDEINRLISEG